MKKIKDFPCTKCGACCRNVSNILSQFAKEDGSCKHLKENNECAIYEYRPLVCRIKESKKLFGLISDERYIDLNISMCKKLIDIYDIDKKFYPVNRP